MLFVWSTDKPKYIHVYSQVCFPMFLCSHINHQLFLVQLPAGRWRCSCPARDTWSRTAEKREGGRATYHTTSIWIRTYNILFTLRFLLPWIFSIWPDDTVFLLPVIMGNTCTVLLLSRGPPIPPCGGSHYRQFPLPSAKQIIVPPLN